MSHRPTTESARLRRDAEALQGAVARLVRLYQFRDRDRICCHDVSVTQSNALEVLAERGPMRSQALADSLRLDKSTTTRVVDALVRKRYVERYPDPEDGRALSLRVTRAGLALHERIARELVDQHVEVLRELDDETRAAVTGTVARLAKAAESRFLPQAAATECAADGCAPAVA